MKPIATDPLHLSFATQFIVRVQPKGSAFALQSQMSTGVQLSIPVVAFLSHRMCTVGRHLCCAFSHPA